MRPCARAWTAGALFCAAAGLASGPAAAQGPPTWMPDEAAAHEGTWLQWPHERTYGRRYRDRLEPTWIEMTRALAPGEKVHVVAFDAGEEARIRSLLSAAGVPLANVDFLLAKTDDVWARDDGPLFVFDARRRQGILDWGFDGWGGDAPWRRDDQVPAAVAGALGLPRADLARIVLEGGAIEVDGRGALMATRSSILEPQRNPGLGRAHFEAEVAPRLGIRKFLWLDGKPGGREDITDMHVDGFARFGPPGVLVTMTPRDLRAWGLSWLDVARLETFRDANGAAFQRVRLPLTAATVVTTTGRDLGYEGSYVNFYVGNQVVLMPAYADSRDSVAAAILQGVFPGRSVVPIDCRNLYAQGGMVHCVTQQQPAP